MWCASVSAQETRRSGLGPEERQQLQGLKEGGRHHSTPKHSQLHCSPEGRSVRHGTTCRRPSVSPSPEPGPGSQRLEEKKIWVSKHRAPSTKPSYSNHGGQESPIRRLDTDMVKHVQTKKRHRERERRHEKKGEEGADERKARILRKLEAKKRKKERQEKRSHRERKGSHRKDEIGGQSEKKTRVEKKRARKAEKNGIKKGERDHLKQKNFLRTPSCDSLSKSPHSAVFDSPPLAALSDTSLCINKYTKHKEESNSDSDSSHTSGFISPFTPPLANQNYSLQCHLKDIANSLTSESDNNLPSSEPTCPNTSSFVTQNKQLEQEDIKSEPSVSSEQEFPMLDHFNGFKEKVPQPEEKSQHAPDLLPAHSNSVEDHQRLDPSASPPVLSWQGSPVSDLSEEEEDEAGSNIAGMIRRPVLQPSPTHSSPVQDLEETWKEPGHSLGLDYRHSDLAKLYGIAEPLKVMEEEEDKEPMAEQKDSSTTSQGPHLHDTDGTLASDSHKYTYRGGPFGWPPPNSVTGVKYSSSLSLRPEIHPPEQHSPTSTSPRAVSPVAMTSLSPSITTSNLSMPNDNMQANEETEEDRGAQEEGDEIAEVVESLKEPICTSLVKENDVKVLSSTLSPATLQAKLAHSCEVLLNQTSSTLLSSEVNSEKKKNKLDKKKQRHGRDSKKQQQKNQKTKTGSSGITEEPSVREHAKQKRNTKDEKQHCSSSGERAKKIVKVHNKQEAAEMKPSETEKEQRKGNMKRAKAKEKTKGRYAGKTKSIFPSGTVHVLSSVPLKELKIQLVKLKISGGQTFIASEFEQKRIPLKEISVNNSAAEIVRACK